MADTSLCRHIVVAMDSLKGCLSAEEATRAITQAITVANENIHVTTIPLSDGGEGMMHALMKANNGDYVTMQAHDALMRPISAAYGLSQDHRTAYIEAAATCGLSLLSERERNPLLTTTYGLGEQIRDCLSRGCKKIILGLGGSATNDCGLGLLQALGCSIHTTSGGNSVCSGKDLAKIVSIDTSPLHSLFQEVELLTACDVKNELYGPRGAAYIFAPQKGANQAMVAELDKGMKHLTTLTRGEKSAARKGAGAAGGLGFCALHFLHGKLCSGIELVLQATRFHDIIQSASLIITGEGKSDRQTLMGKLPSGVLAAARKQHIPVVLMAGEVQELADLQRAGFYKLININEGFGTDRDYNMQPIVAYNRLQTATRNLLRQLCLAL
ncbi:MAG: glycerate kinase [Bacteroidales bacterium]|nr:glycerate kinase [Bacteroidales bacterium]